SCRGALFAILKSFGIGEEDEVIVQAYTCVAVPNAVLWAGARPIYADIDLKTFNMAPEDFAKKISPKTRAIIVQHTFGIPADMEKIMEIARANNILVIEDLAHALGARYHGKLLGTFGDAAFLSFGRDKILSSVFGGAAVIHDTKFAGELEQFWQSLSYPSFFWILQQLAHPIFLASAKSLYGVFGIGRFALASARRLKLISKAVYPEEKEGGMPSFAVRKMPEALAMLALAQFKKLSRFNAHRCEIAALYREELAAIPAHTSKPYPNSEPVYLRFPLRIDGADEIIRAARNNATQLGDWYNTPIAPRGVNFIKVFYRGGSCPNAEQAARESVNLPTHINLGERDVQTIVAFLKKYYARS
ncbi:MAG: DegT/DnrJ/EryC1/StrS family aminotransferase, partial [Patescibacteria group bacterium]